MNPDIEALQSALRQFSQERDWGQFHSPKNLAMALAVEASELLEHFQWLTEDQSRSLSEQQISDVGSEIADVLLYLLQISDALGIDPLRAAQQKMLLNAKKYPVELAKGRSTKYTDL